jgi:hypothetical protein
MLNVSTDDIRAWCGNSPDEVRKLVDEIIDGVSAADDLAPGEDVPTADTEDTSADIPTVDGRWDSDTGQYVGYDGSIWKPTGEKRNGVVLLDPVNGIAHRWLKSVKA